MKTYGKFEDLEKKHLTPERIEKNRKWAEAEIVKMNLREIRKLTGKTQVEVAKKTKMTQGHLSSVESRDDHLVSTLRNYVKALGGELEIIARFGDKCVKLNGV